MNRTILILGGTGMLGHVLVKELEKESNFNVLILLEKISLMRNPLFVM